MDDLQPKLNSLGVQVRFLRWVCILQAALFLLAVAGMFRTRPVSADTSGDVLRLKGLIIEDAQGRPRILLGAPFPKAQNRKRQDDGSAAMLFLNENGADRLLVGEGIGAQIAGKVYSQKKRAVQGESYGILIMDGEGNERGGYGFTALPGGGGRGVITLDRPVGDAWGAMVDDKTQFVGELINYPMPLGQYQPALEMGVQKEWPFLHFKDKNDYPRAEISEAPDGTPSFTVADAKGKKLGDIFGQLTRK
jgi:hypothetical protein